MGTLLEREAVIWDLILWEHCGIASSLARDAIVARLQVGKELCTIVTDAGGTILLRISWVTLHWAVGATRWHWSTKWCELPIELISGRASVGGDSLWSQRCVVWE